MNENISVEYNIDPFWHIISRIREDVNISLNAYSDELKDASAMTASELVENAVKYSSHVQEGSSISFNMTADDSRITICLKNRIRSKRDFAILKSNIEKIILSENPQELYIKQLEYLMENSGTHRTGLGLYRIAYEGAFNLGCKLEEDMLTVEAVRNI